MLIRDKVRRERIQQLEVKFTAIAYSPYSSAEKMNLSPNQCWSSQTVSHSEPKLRGVKISSSIMMYGKKRLINGNVNKCSVFGGNAKRKKCCMS